VIKKDRTREPYDRNKIMAGIMRACHKRPIPVERLEETMNKIENDIYNLGYKEVESGVIGEIVMEHLKNLEEVAYVRFASVYREFKDVNTFMNELKKMLDGGSEKAKVDE
jgi:transcriptional repressor NrdR